eukprot:CAMPEP_0184483656 /NCGR_PEP_ID=MMETSP0113_2-20130426/5340_1 /TAXON_ID=91329 /ORGANISM="Norrisiella sphaerica, Strain BC52" /LENGTH=383 /DNA_ID=CAMNT_0026864207 /DNA_START=211 /DNA_END=1362 /DNA_ORIENTATION=-
MSTSGIEMQSKHVYESVSNYYGKVLTTSKDLKTSACTTAARPSEQIIQALQVVPNTIKDKYYGCGTPLPDGIQGLDILDLGSGSGRDCYVAAALVGPTGSVTGVDMTDEQLEVARKFVPDYMDTLGYASPNLEFKKGYIEFLQDAGVEKESVDMVISNCVINLSPNKELVLQGVYNALREGGELYFSDVYCDRRLPEEVRNHEVMLGECLGGALYLEDFRRICQRVGFLDPRQLSVDPIAVTDPELQALCGNAKFYSITYRCFKLSGMETLCEDYGQVAYYKGTLPNNPNSYMLDDHHIFETNRPMLVCGNTASMVEDTWLGKHFEVIGNREVHYGLFETPLPTSGIPDTPAVNPSGLFDCGPSPSPSAGDSEDAPKIGGGCC